VPLLLSASEPVFHVLWNAVGELPALYAALRVLLMGLVLVVPTTLMGATLPVLTRYLSDSSQAAAGEAGRAYAINTFGGVAGTLASGLWLIPAFGLRATTAVAVGLNLAIAAAALLLARGKSGTTEPALAAEASPRRLALVVSALSGFSSLIYEVAWTRSLVLSLGSTVYAFTLILTAFILGLAAGSALSSRFLRRVTRPEAALALIQALIGIAAIALFHALGDLPIRMAPTAGQYRDHYGDLLVAHAKLIAVFVFIPTLLIGAVFPFTFRLASGSDRSVGRSVAAVYTWNTLGSIVGSLAASFVLVPMLGLATSIRIAASINLLVAAGVMLASPLPRPAAVAPLLAAGVAWLIPAWDARVLASGAYLYGKDYEDTARALHIDLKTYLARESTILGEYWDAYGLTTVHRSEDGNLSIRVNGKADASTGTSDLPTQRFVGHLGMLHHPAPQRALVIGLGSGVTLGAVGCHPVRQVDCVEISPAGVRAAEYFASANGSILKDPRVRLVIGDGRNAVQFAKEPYDVIVSQPSNLWISGMANLFTRDFFAMASRHLSKGGIFCQWVQAYRLPLDDFQSILRTFFEVFPHGSLWEVFPGKDYIMIGSLDPVRVAYADLESRMASPSMQHHFDGLTVPGAAGLLGHLITTAEAVRRNVTSAALLTDDLSHIEYSTSRAMLSYYQPRTIAWVDELWKIGLDPDVYPGLRAGPVEKSRESRRRIATVIAYESEQRTPREVLEFLAVQTSGLGDDEPTRHHFEQFAYLARLQARYLRESGKFAEALRVLAAIPRESKHYPDALFERAHVALAAGKLTEARRSTEQLLREYPGSFGALCIEAQAAEDEGKVDEAVRRWTRATELRADASAYAHLAGCLQKASRTDAARAACRKALELDPEQPSARRLLDQLGK
jgi:spermidine synthase